MIEPGRTVSDGELQPINGAQMGQSIDSMGNPLQVVNNGKYSSNTAILSFGVEFFVDEFFGFAKKPTRYMNNYEDPDWVPPPKPKKEDKKVDEPKDTGDTSDDKGSSSASSDDPTPNIPKTEPAAGTPTGSPAQTTPTSPPKRTTPPKRTPPKRPKPKKNDFEL
jgi:hypothetical protein